MYQNIGEKIKFYAIGIAVFGIITCVIIGIVFIRTEEAMRGLAIIVFGSLGAWVASWFLYAYGELIENVSGIASEVACIRQNYQQNRENNVVQNQNRVAVHTQNKINKPMNLHEIVRKKESEVKEEKWFCPKCGDKNNIGKIQCASCGYYR